MAVREVKKSIVFIRHGYSETNKKMQLGLPMPEILVRGLKRVAGTGITAMVLNAADAFRGFHTPFPIPDKETPLTEIGHMQAYITGCTLMKKGIVPDQILCSTHRRAVDTAFEIVLGLGPGAITRSGRYPKITYSPLLVERNYGKRYGYPSSYSKVLFPAEYKARKARPCLYRPPGGESMYDIYDNRIPPLMKLINKMKFRTLFVVGHAATNLCVMAQFTGKDLEKDLEKVYPNVSNLGVFRLVYQDKTRSWKLDPHYKGNTISKAVPVTI